MRKTAYLFAIIYYLLSFLPPNGAILFCCFQSGNQDALYFQTIRNHGLSLRFRQIFGHHQQSEPILRFSGFLQGDLQFGDKIRFADTIDGFICVGSDAGSAPDNLIGNHCFMLFFGKVLIELNNPGRKLQGFWQNNAVLAHSGVLLLQIIDKR